MDTPARGFRMDMNSVLIIDKGALHISFLSSGRTLLPKYLLTYIDSK